MFVCQPLFSTLKLKRSKATDHVIGWNSRALFRSKRFWLDGAFSHNIKYFGYKIGIQFNNTSSFLEQKNYVTKIVNAYIIYDLDNWPNKFLRNFTLKDWLFGTTGIVTNGDKKLVA